MCDVEIGDVVAVRSDCGKGDLFGKVVGIGEEGEVVRVRWLDGVESDEVGVVRERVERLSGDDGVGVGVVDLRWMRNQREYRELKKKKSAKKVDRDRLERVERVWNSLLGLDDGGIDRMVKVFN